MIDPKDVHLMEQRLAGVRDYAQIVSAFVDGAYRNLLDRGWSPWDAREASVRLGVAHMQRPPDPPTVST